MRPGARPPAHAVRRVALAPLSDFPGAPGSGLLAARAFARALSRAGYEVAERRDRADAVVYAELTDYSEAVPEQVRVFPPAAGAAEPFSWVAKWDSARFGLRARLVDASSGDELALAWAASRPDRFQSALDYTYHLTAGAAAEQACGALAQALGQAGATRSKIVTAAAK